MRLRVTVHLGSASSGTVMLMRMLLAAVEGASTRIATLSRWVGSAIIASSVDGSGKTSPSSIIPSMCKARASVAKRRASSSEMPAEMQPGKSGKDTP